jgi:hypothetical protein
MVLYAFECYKYSDGAREFVDYNLSTIPRSWADPEFLDGFEGGGYLFYNATRARTDVS